MAATGYAAIVVEGEPVVVRVEATVAARVAMAIAGLVLPLGGLLSVLSADESAPLGRDATAPFAIVILGLLLLGTALVTLARGTVCARLFVGVEAREVDAQRWTFAPRRDLDATIGATRCRVALSPGPVREARFTVGDEPPRGVPLR